MNESARKNAEVKQIRARIAAAIGCATCALGIAIDIVDRRWGAPGVAEWKCGNQDCAAARDGLTPGQVAAVRALEDELMGGTSSPPTPAPPAGEDSRLPPEKDEDENRPPEGT